MSKMDLRLEVKLKAQMFEPTDPISILSFFPMFQKDFDKNGVHEGSAIWCAASS